MMDYVFFSEYRHKYSEKTCTTDSIYSYNSFSIKKWIRKQVLKSLLDS
jgi:hypothetical protein